AGQNRLEKAGSGNENKEPDKSPPKDPVPTISDVESSQQPQDKKPQENQEGKAKPSDPKLRLPMTMVAGSGKSKPKPNAPQSETVDEAVKQQENLLAEFDKIADELNRVLANLEGSTLVKRLKAAARLQNRIALKIGDQVGGAFGVPTAGLRDPE